MATRIWRRLSPSRPQEGCKLITPRTSQPSGVLTFVVPAGLEIRARGGEDQAFDSVNSTTPRLRRALVDLGKKRMVRIDGNDNRTTQDAHSVELRAPDCLA